MDKELKWLRLRLNGVYTEIKHTINILVGFLEITLKEEYLTEDIRLRIIELVDDLRDKIHYAEDSYLYLLMRYIREKEEKEREK